MCSSIMGPEKDESGKANKYRSVGTGTPSPSADARPKGQSPVLSESRHAGRTALCPNVFSTGGGPNPRLIFPPEFWWVGPLFALNTFVNSAID